MPTILLIRDTNQAGCYERGLYIIDEGNKVASPFILGGVLSASISTNGMVFALVLRPGYELLLINLPAQEYKIFSSREIGVFNSVNCSPGGNVIVEARQSNETKKGGQFFLIDTTSIEMEPLHFPENAICPRWINDKEISFLDAEKKAWYSLELGTRFVKQLDFINEATYDLSWAENGQRAFWVTRNRKRIVCLNSVQNEKKVCISLSEGVIERLWAYPDGKKLLYSAHSDIYHGYELYTVNSDSGGNTKLTNLPLHCECECVEDVPCGVVLNWSEVSGFPVWRKAKEYLKSRNK
jgi:hypothetical protein